MKMVVDKIELLVYSILLVGVSLFALLISIFYGIASIISSLFEFVKTGDLETKTKKTEDPSEQKESNNQLLVEKESAQLISIIEKVGVKNNVLSDLIFQLRLVAINARTAADSSNDPQKELRAIAKEIKLLSSLADEVSGQMRKLVKSSIKTGEKLVDQTHGNIVKKVDEATHRMKKDIDTSDKLQIDYKEILGNLKKMTNLSPNTVKEKHANKNKRAAKKSRRSNKLDTLSHFTKKKKDRQLDNVVVEIKHFIDERNKKKPMNNKVLKEFKNNVIDITQQLELKAKEATPKTKKNKRFVRK
jgi:hypothetical protein